MKTSNANLTITEGLYFWKGDRPQQWQEYRDEKRAKYHGEAAAFGNNPTRMNRKALESTAQDYQDAHDECEEMAHAIRTDVAMRDEVKA